jgi:hypothetical protein
MSGDDSVLRQYQRDLIGLNKDGSPCEVCGKHMHDHEWADLDIKGYVVACSEQP